MSTEKIKIQLIDKITVTKINDMGGDHMVVAAAKVSTSGESAAQFADPANHKANFGLINYLMSHRHGTPFEHAALTFFVHAPIFVWREWHRHRIGFCLAGDTEIYGETVTERSGRTLRKMRLDCLCDRWNNGVKDNMGRIRKLPSVYNQTLRVLNENTHLFELGQIDDVYQSGIKELFLLETEDSRYNRLKCSADHRVFTSDGWAKLSELSGNEHIYVVGKRNANTISVPPSLRRGIGVWTSMQRNRLIRSIDFCSVCDEGFAREELILDHVVPVVEDLKKALDIKNLRPICATCHRLKTNQEQKLSNRNIVAGSKLVKLLRKPIRYSEEMTYDVSMRPPWHNFVANGIVVHNSYNEESGRYKQLDPVFWVPPQGRKIVPAPGHTSARPQFQAGTADDESYIRDTLATSYRIAYESYAAMLEKGYAKEVARACLPVGIYSSCWVTCNPRSLMSFLSLRTHEPEAKFVSYPQAEIEEAARSLEEIFALGWPLTYKAFNENGRVGP